MAVEQETILNRRVTMLYRLRTQYDEDTALSMYGDAHPEKKSAIQDLMEQYGSDTTFRMLIDAIHPGALPPPEPTVTTEPFEERKEGVAEKPSVAEPVPVTPTEEEPSLAERWLGGLEAAEEVQRAVPRAMTEGLLAAYSKAVGKPLEKLGTEVIQPAVRWMRAQAVEAPTVEEIKWLIDRPSKERPRMVLAEIAARGLLPTAEEMGEDYMEKLLAKSPKWARLFEPYSSRVRRGEYESPLSPEAVAKHPILSVVPVFAEEATKAYVAEPLTHPEQWPRIAAAVAAGHYVVMPLIGKGIGALAARSAAKRGILVKDISTPLRTFLSTKKVTLSRQSLRAFFAGLEDPELTPQVSAALKGLSDKQLNRLVSQLRKGKGEFRIAVPRKYVAPTPTEPVVTPEGEFFPPVPYEAPGPAAPPVTPTPAPSLEQRMLDMQLERMRRGVVPRAEPGVKPTVGPVPPAEVVTPPPEAVAPAAEVPAVEPEAPPALDPLNAVRAVITDTPVHITVIAERTGLPPSELASALVRLELAGEVNQQVGKMFVKAEPPPVIPPEEAPPVPEMPPEVLPTGKDIEALKSLGYSESQIQRLRPEEAERMVNEQIAAEHVSVSQTGEARVLEGPESPVDRVIQRNAEEVRQRMSEKEEAGFFAWGRKEIPETEIKDPDLRAALYAGRKRSKTMAGFGERVKGIGRDIADFASAELEPDLKKAMPQFWDDYRTEALPIGIRSREKAEAALGGIWGTLKKPQRETLINLMGMRTFLQSAGEGIEVPRRLTADVIQAEYDRLVAKAGPEVMAGLEKYQEFAQAVGEDLVARGKLEAEALKEFYFPHKVLDYLPEWWTNTPLRPRRVRQPYRPYTKTRAGSAKDIAVSEEALFTHFANVFADNMMDDWALSQLPRYDILPTLSKEQKTALGKIRPNGIYKVGDETYRGFQYVPGNMLYPAEAANPSLLQDALEDAALDVERLLKKRIGIPAEELWPPGDMSTSEYIVSRSPEEQAEILQSYLEDVGPRGGNALRRVMAIGSYNRIYVIPEPMYNKIVRFKDPAGYIPLLYDVIGYTTFWKRLTLSPIGAGLPFQLGNFMGDTLNLYRTSPGAAKQIIPTAWRILKHMRDPEKLNAFESEVLRIALEKDVLGSGFLREYSTVDPLLSAKGLWHKYERLSGLREGLNRVAMVAYQLKRHTDGLPFKAPEFEKFIKDLDAESAIGYIARNFTVDYLAVPDYYRRYVRGLGFPFATFWQKNAKNWALYAKGAPAGFTAKFIAPIALAWTYNNTGKRREIEENLGYFRQRTFHLNLKGFDDDGDGKYERALIFAPQLPHDMAAEFIGVNLLLDKVTLVRKGVMTPKEAAITQLTDMGLATPQLLKRLTSPMIQIMQGLISNKDPWTQRQIVPGELENLPDRHKMKYYVPFIADKLFTPFGQYMRGLDRSELSLVEQLTSPAPAVVRPLLTGPLDVGRGLGFYIVDLARQEAREMMNLSSQAKAKRAMYMTRMENAFLDSGLNPAEFIASEQAKRIFEEAALQDIVLDTRTALSRLISPRVTRSYLQEQLRKERDPEERKRLEQQIRGLDNFRAGDYFKRIPLGAKPEVIKRKSR